jgi:hypothetical protein
LAPTEHAEAVGHFAARAGISQAANFNWKKCDGLLPAEMRRLE